MLSLLVRRRNITSQLSMQLLIWAYAVAVRTIISIGTIRSRRVVIHHCILPRQNGRSIARPFPAQRYGGVLLRTFYMVTGPACINSVWQIAPTFGACPHFHLQAASGALVFAVHIRAALVVFVAALTKFLVAVLGIVGSGVFLAAGSFKVFHCFPPCFIFISL